MEPTYLIQRLLKPQKHSPFSFGGGMENGGFSKKEIKQLEKILQFDYMGSSEFERGGVPEAFNMSKDASWKIKIGEVIVYIIGREKDQVEINKRVRKITTGKMKLKQPALFGMMGCVGWIDLTNGFMFFTDQEMYNGMKKFLKIKE